MAPLEVNNMVNTFILIGGAVAFAAASFGFYYSLKRKKDYEFMSFLESINLTELPIVTFNVGSSKLNFLLDTGCNVSIINESVLKHIEYNKLSSTSAVFGLEGVITQCALCRINLTYKNNNYIEDFQILDIDRTIANIKKESGVNVHGMLGTAFFKRYKSILDFSEFKAYFKK